MSYGYGLRPKNEQSAAKSGGKKMSEKISQNVLLEKLNLAYPNNNIKILEWNGYTKPLTFLCDKCGEIHTISDARQTLNKKTYCQKDSKNNVKWDLESFNERINKMHKEQVEIIEYNGLSNPVKYYCPKCHNVKSCNPARTLITRLSLCDACYGIEKDITKKAIDKAFNESTEYKMIVWHGADKKMVIKHEKCGNIYKRYPKNVLDSFDSCPYCNSGAIKQRLNLNVMQKRIDDAFGEGQYKLIDYKGQLQKDSKIKCLNCGLVFNAQCSYFPETRGCPKCKKYKSKGEQMVQRFLEENNIPFESQKRFKDCNNNLSSFDFCVYDKNNVMHLIEVNGRQHYFGSERFGDLETIQRRDQLKIDYCKEKNIDLIIIPYSRLTQFGINSFLSFLKGSTTIPEGSKE